jgi:hypothetical protein
MHVIDIILQHNLEAMKVEPDANHETNLAPSFEENQFIEMKEKGYPISITFPVINAEIQVSYVFVC